MLSLAGTIVAPPSLSIRTSRLVTPSLTYVNSENYLQCGQDLESRNVVKETSRLRKKMDDKLLGSLHAKVNFMSQILL